MVAGIGKDLGALSRVGGVGRNWQGYIYFLPESSLIVVDGLGLSTLKWWRIQSELRASYLCNPFTEVLSANLQQLYPDRIEKHFSCKEKISEIHCT